MPSWESEFPHLGKWAETSPRDNKYNCAAFAARDEKQKWDPLPPNLHYWPKNIPRSYAIDSFIQAYATIGFEICADGSLDPECEKIVIYANEYGGVEHVARQLKNGKWTSKMGDEEDIVHDTPHNLSVGYGQPVCYMGRARELTTITIVPKGGLL
jgi:hypothetical protein